MELLETLQAGEERFRAAECDIGSPELKPLFQQYSLQRRKFANALQTLLRSVDDNTVEVHPAVGLAFQAAAAWAAGPLAGDDYSVLVECERGEAETVAQYEKSLCQPGLPGHVIDVLHDQYLKTRATHETMRTLRDSIATAGTFRPLEVPVAS